MSADFIFMRLEKAVVGLTKSTAHCSLRVKLSTVDTLYSLNHFASHEGTCTRC